MNIQGAEQREQKNGWGHHVWPTASNESSWRNVASWSISLCSWGPEGSAGLITPSLITHLIYTWLLWLCCSWMDAPLLLQQPSNNEAWLIGLSYWENWACYWNNQRRCLRWKLLKCQAEINILHLDYCVQMH